MQALDSYCCRYLSYHELQDHMGHAYDHLQDVFFRDCDRVQLCRICGISLHNCLPFYDDLEKDGGLLPRNHLDDHMRYHRGGCLLGLHLVHDNVDDDDSHVHGGHRNHVSNDLLRDHLNTQELLQALHHRIQVSCTPSF